MGRKVYKLIRTANDEEPDCMRCENVTSASEDYCAECGRNMWCHYRRSEFVEVEKEDV